MTQVPGRVLSTSAAVAYVAVGVAAILGRSIAGAVREALAWALPSDRGRTAMTTPGRAQQPAIPTTEPSRRRVLLVEDDADHRRLLAWMLRADGWEVVEAESGVELLDRIGVATSTPRGAGFDAIVSDVNMPDLTAIEVLSGWRYGAWPVPLILITASDDPTIRSEGNALGASAVLTKPIGRNDLHQALERALARRRPSEGPLTPRP